MYKKKMTVLTLASLMTLSLPLCAEEASSTQAESGEDATVAPAAAAPSTARDEAMAAMQERWRERDARYEELKARAKEMGVVLPDEPPWKSARQEMMSSMAEHMSRRQSMMSMTPEQRMAAREAEYRERLARARERGVEMPEAPPWEAGRTDDDEQWAKYQAVIDGMSDEERAACHAMHRRHMGMMRYDRPERPTPRGPSMGRGMMGPDAMEPGWGPGMGPGMMGPDATEPAWGSGMGPGMMEPGWGSGPMGRGYGYGPNSYAPQNFWDPNQ